VGKGKGGGGEGEEEKGEGKKKGNEVKKGKGNPEKGLESEVNSNERSPGEEGAGAEKSSVLKRKKGEGGFRKRRQQAQKRALHLIARPLAHQKRRPLPQF